MMKLSYSTKLYYNYRLEDTIRRASKAGYPGVEIWGGRPHAYYKDMDKESISSIIDAINETGTEISGFIPAQFGYPTNLCSPIENIRKNSVEYIKKSIDTSLALGCKKVSLCPGRTLYGQGYKQGMENLNFSLSALVNYAIKKDVLLLLEPAHMLESDLILTIEDGARLIEEQGYNNMGIALDTGHCHINKESLVDAVYLLNQKQIPIHIHLDDNNTMGDQHKIPGEGTIDFVPFFRALLEIGYKGFLTVELGFDYTANPDAAAYKSKKVVLSLLEEAETAMG
ncbi:sugar phosphate isomerase/epimerase [Mariniphaga sediminis]|uniref:Sugar phosphate isomerase/epimerase n=1 Tax=Mariniphaga sediminis TaxID=1628158 RepID=A0A399DAK8_9BACT|nr:sugar phosphate isomerase/epimerase family protein [Mariniphaga sediminis]RIH67010.1 sugar phosphate isomerase/epimerase [Mariniphaga sediminis]